MSFIHSPADHKNGHYFIHPREGIARIVVIDGRPHYHVFESEEMRRDVEVLYSARMKLEDKPDGGRWLVVGGPVLPETCAFYRCMLSAGVDHSVRVLLNQAGATLLRCDESAVALACANEDAVPDLLAFFDGQFHVWMNDVFEQHAWRDVIELELGQDRYDRRIAG